VAVQRGDLLLTGFNLGNTGPAGVLHQLVAVLVGSEPHGRSLHPHGQVLGDNGDVPALVGEVLCDGEDAAVVVPAAEAQRQHLRGDVVELHHQGAAVVTDGNGLVESAVLDPEVVKEPQCLPCEVAKLGVMPFGFQFGDHDDRNDDLVFRKAQQRTGV
jgi:hypothetical protein